MTAKFLIFLLLFTFHCFSQEKNLAYYLAKAQKNTPFLADLSNQIKTNSLDSLTQRATLKTQINANAIAF